MQTQQLTIAPVALSLNGQPKIIPYLYVHIYRCIFTNGIKKQFEFEYASERKLRPAQEEEWRAANVREVFNRYGIPMYSHSKSKTYLHGKLINEWELVPQVYCHGKFIDTLSFFKKC